MKTAEVLLLAATTAALMTANAAAQDAGAQAGHKNGLEAAEPVRAELQIPDAQTHVIGDWIPLVWQFENVSDISLAFLWEGCCRLNGRLDAFLNDEPLPPVPPGPSTAHVFSRPETLAPGVPQKFQTWLADWIAPSASGRLKLQGRYTGVLPEQQPRVPPGIELWRGTVVTPPIEINLLSASDYLESRPHREKQQGLAAALRGPEQLPPLDGAVFNVTLRNLSGTARQVAWPDDFSLWIINSDGRRLAIGAPVQSLPKRITLAPGAIIEEQFTFDVSRLWGEPFGRLRMFLDLAGTNFTPRTPSQPANISWEITPADFQQLILRAAEGSETGARNPALRLLRIYLAELVPQFQMLPPDTLPEKAAALLAQLKLAACLKPFAPRAGQVNLPVRASSGGEIAFAEAVPAECLPDFSFSDRLRALYAVRRHLGVEFAIDLQPAPEMTVAEINNASAGIAATAGEPVVPPRLLVHDGSQTAPGIVHFRSEPIPATLVIRIGSRNGNLDSRMVRRNGGSGMDVRWMPAEIGGIDWESAPATSHLDAWLDDGRLPYPRILVLSEREVQWNELRDVLAPALRRGFQISVVVLPR